MVQPSPPRTTSPGPSTLMPGRAGPAQTSPGSTPPAFGSNASRGIRRSPDGPGAKRIAGSAGGSDESGQTAPSVMTWRLAPRVPSRLSMSTWSLNPLPTQKRAVPGPSEAVRAARTLVASSTVSNAPCGQSRHFSAGTEDADPPVLRGSGVGRGEREDRDRGRQERLHLLQGNGPQPPPPSSSSMSSGLSPSRCRRVFEDPRGRRPARSVPSGRTALSGGPFRSAPSHSSGRMPGTSTPLHAWYASTIACRDWNGEIRMRWSNV